MTPQISPDFVMQVIGQQALEIAALRVRVAQLEEAAKPKEAPDNVVPLNPQEPPAA